MDSENQSDKMRDYLYFQIERKLTNQSVDYLEQLEDLVDEGFPINYNRMRKRILDKLNNSKNEIADTIKKLDIKLR